MIRVAFAKVKPDKVERLESWLLELMSRQDEVRETFIQETVRHEQAFILRGEDGPLLIYVMEAEDPERGVRHFSRLSFRSTWNIVGSWTRYSRRSSN